MGDEMTEPLHDAGARPALQYDDPETWAPREAPLDMPCQDVEPRLRLIDLAQVLRLILPGQRI
jgi:hypothetical protein